MGVAGSYYKPIAIELSKQARVAFTTDYRGIGHSSVAIHHHHLTPDEAGISDLNHFNWVRQPQGIGSIIQEWVTQQK